MSKRRQTKQSKSTNHAPRLFHIAVGSGKFQGSALSHDLQMIKAALLYGDQATVYSHESAFALHTMVEMHRYSARDMAYLMELLLLYGQKPSARQRASLANVKRFKELLESTRPRSIDDVRFMIKFEADMRRHWPQIIAAMRETVQHQGGSGLTKAIESGLVKVAWFGTLGQRTEIERFVTMVGEALGDANTYPLFDFEASMLMRQHLATGQTGVRQPALRQGKQVTLAADLFRRLPLFPDATVEEILDIREELRPYLVRFRKAIIDLSNGIQSEVWDDNFAFDVETVVRRDVEPALEDIESAVNANSYLRQLVPKLLKAPMTVPVGSFLSVSVAQFADWPMIASMNLAAGVTAVAAGVLAALDARQEWQKQQRDLETKNGLIWYYKAREKLS